jgi:hypothetical protein
MPPKKNDAKAKSFGFNFKVGSNAKDLIPKTLTNPLREGKPFK